MVCFTVVQQAEFGIIERCGKYIFLKKFSCCQVWNVYWTRFCAVFDTNIVNVFKWLFENFKISNFKTDSRKSRGPVLPFWSRASTPTAEPSISASNRFPSPSKRRRRITFSSMCPSLASTNWTRAVTISSRPTELATRPTTRYRTRKIRSATIYTMSSVPALSKNI